MGVINVTPDSFSDGGKYYTPTEAIRRARKTIKEGAAIIDIGGESTRPDAKPITWQEEWDRVEPVLDGLFKDRERLPAALSIDTAHPETAERALKKGATIVNCVRSEPIADMSVLCVRFGAELVLPASAVENISPTAQSVPLYLDPMIGFGTTREEDLERIRSLNELTKRGRVLIGVSRKRIVKKLTGVKITGKDLAGNLTLAVWCALQGASVIRVHDVAETVQALRVVHALVSPQYGHEACHSQHA